MKQTIRKTLYFWMILSLVALPAKAVETVNTDLTIVGAHPSKCHHTIYGNYQKYPKSYIKNGRATGILIDILNYVGKEMNCSFTIELAPWKRSYNNMINGRGGIMGLSITSERMKIIDYSDVVYYDNLMIVVIKGKEFNYESIEDLTGKRVLSTRGASYGDEWEDAVRARRIELIEDGGRLTRRIQLLLKDRADAAIIGPGVASLKIAIEADPFLRKYKNKIVILKKPLKRDSNHIGFLKTMNQRKFIKRLNKYIAKGFKSGVFQSYIDKYADQKK